MRSRISLLLTVCAATVAVSQFRQADAAVDLWKGTASTDWNTTTNWAAYPSGTAFVPQDSGGFHLRPLIGNDNPTLGALAGTAVISAQLPGTPPATGKLAVSGIALGMRQLNTTVAQPYPFLFTPAPAPGALTGSLTIHAGTLNNVAGAPTLGDDGRILVGVDGRGYLTMDGGELIGLGLVVAGENVSTGAGTSLVSLSGSSKLTINGTSTFNRRLRVEGPSVNFSTNGGQLQLNGSSSYTAAITSATSHSSLTTNNNALISGSLFVEFSGAAATRDPIASLGQTWDLVTSTLSTNAIDGNFTNLTNGDVVVSGLDAAHAAPIGGAYHLQKVNIPPDGTFPAGQTKIQLVYDKVLILRVNRDTGELSLRNPYAGNIKIDNYAVTSPLGSLVASYNGLGASTPGAGVWVKPTDGGAPPVGLNNANALSEVKEPDFTPPNVNNDSYDLTSVPSVSLGNGFNRLAVAGNIANFGTDGEDLSFEYSGPGGIQLRGAIEYVGTKFENNLVLRVNPNTGQAFIKNDSLVTLKFDGYSVLSSTGALDGAGFTGLGGTWQSSPATSGALSQTNLTGSTTLAPGAQLAIGDISVSAFSTLAAQNGLSLQFILSEGLVSSAAPGDYNNNGVVDAADYTVWRDHLGQTFALSNEGSGVTTGTVTIEDYNLWKTNFGQTGGAVPETTFRVGSIVFDATAGSGSGSVASVPEPGTAWLALGFGIVLFGIGARRRQASMAVVANGTSEQVGAVNMSKVFSFGLSAVLACCGAFFCHSPATAAPAGISLTNFDFTLPGPIGTKVLAFNADGTVNAGIIPGWTFTGGQGGSGETLNVGVETFGHDGTGTSQLLKGDSGTEGGGFPGNELLLSSLDGRTYQTGGGGFLVHSITANEQYKFSFDAHEIFSFGATTADGRTGQNGAQLTIRMYYGPSRTTLTTYNVITSTTNTHYEFVIPSGDPLLTTANNQSLGIEFDTTSLEYNTTSMLGIQHSWIGVDNVVMEIGPVKKGDLDGNGVVNSADYTILKNNLQIATPFEALGELTGDNLVDLNDFRVMKQLQGTGSGSVSSASGAVPEPTSLSLVLIVAATSSLLVRKRMPGLPRVRLSLLAVGGTIAALAATSPSSAVLLYYDPFMVGPNPAAGEYTLGLLDPSEATGDGQNPTIGPTPFFTGAWESPATATLPGDQLGDTVQAQGLSYRGVPAPGGSVIAGDANARVGRYLQTKWTGTTTGTYYLSFFANFGVLATPTSGMGFRTVEFWPENNPVGLDDGRSEVGFQQFAGTAPQQNPATARMQVIFGNGVQILSNAPNSFNEDGGITHLIVFKFTLSDQANMDSVKVILDPTNGTEPIVGSATATGVNFTFNALSTISMFGGNGILPSFDEVRVGTTYIDVLPHFPLPGDTNNDDKVDQADYSAILHHMNLSGQTIANGDVTGDGKVTVADYRLWKDNRTDIPNPGSGSGTGVPEPTAFVMALLGVMASLFVRIR